MNEYQKNLEQISKQLKVPPKDAHIRVEKLQEELSQQQKKISALENEIAKSKAGTLFEQAKDIEGGKLLVARVDGIAPKALKEMVEKASDKLGSGIVVLASVSEGKISVISKVSDNFVQKGVNAGQIVNEIAQKCGGKGGGRPNFAQAGASDATQLDAALEELKAKF